MSNKSHQVLVHVRRDCLLSASVRPSKMTSPVILAVDADAAVADIGLLRRWPDIDQKRSVATKVTLVYLS
jgi:hypothetical protein